MDRRQLAAGVSEAKRRADLAETAGEIPVGACILSPSGEIIASASNLCEEENDQTRHAEIICISEA
ncbi:MAG TPA: tRNA-specific adenosine deaminase, partial [Firmicutes bacterium]|nr:tRNA-specific adenosine deaminase [Bacillota bacterium]